MPTSSVARLHRPNQLDYDSKVESRLFDFFHRARPWYRKLWSIGTVLGIKEVVEYSLVRRESQTPPNGLEFVCETMLREVNQDPGCQPYANQIIT